MSTQRESERSEAEARSIRHGLMSLIGIMSLAALMQFSTPKPKIEYPPRFDEYREEYRYNIWGKMTSPICLVDTNKDGVADIHILGKSGSRMRRPTETEQKIFHSAYTNYMSQRRLE